ncbi:MAG: alpha/beta hydrolase fold domain-containing protein [Terriglobales bacterium]
MNFHGGGWILGSKTTHDRLLRDLVNGTHAAFGILDVSKSKTAHCSVRPTG